MILKRIARTAASSFQKLKWFLEMHTERAALKNIQCDTQLHKGEILIIAPHSDDEWIGCSQLFLNYEDCVICNMDMEGGDDPDIHIQRLRETESLANLFNKKIYLINENKTESLTILIDEIKPKYICVPYYIDWHNEHIAVMKIVQEAGKDYKGSVIMYQVSCPIPADDIDFVLGMSKDDLAQKWSIFRRIYSTQSYLPVTRFICSDRINGKYVDEFAAEAYSIKDYQSWCDNLSRIPEEKECVLLKQSINNLHAIRIVSNSIYRNRCRK